METYTQIRERHTAAWGQALGDRLGRLKWSRAQIDAERDRALRALVHAARSGSPWHGPRLAHVDVERLTATDLSSLPTMTKQDVLAEFDDLVTDRRVTRAAAEEHLSRLTGDAYLAGDLHVVASGGSTGERAVFVYGWDAWIDVHLGLGRFVASLFEEPDIPSGTLTTAVVAAHSASHMTSAVRRDVPRTRGRTALAPGHVARAGHRGRPERAPARRPHGLRLDARRAGR